MWHLLAGLLLLAMGIIFSSFGKRPWIDYDFIVAWYGFLLVLDAIAKRLGKDSLFSKFRIFLQLAFASSFFWWFYEFANIYLQNWAYPLEKLYNQTEWGIFSTIAFTTVLPLLIISTNITEGLIFKKSYQFAKSSLDKYIYFFFITLGFLLLLLALVFPILFFPFIWFVILFIFDPLNALQGKRSLIVQLIKRNYRPLLILTLASLFAGFCWETMNYVIPKWTYPIAPWFWELPQPITTKYFEMPLAGFLGYIPFIFSAFSFVEFLDLDIPWLKRNSS